jgi:hypothetical protein
MLDAIGWTVAVEWVKILQGLEELAGVEKD